MSNEDFRSVLASLKPKILREELDAEKEFIQAKLKLAQEYINRANDLMQEAGERTHAAGQKAKAAGMEPDVDPAQFQSVASEPHAALARASYGVGRMLGWLAIFFASMIGAGALTGNGPRRNPAP